MGAMPSPANEETGTTQAEVSRYIVALLGAQGVGKTALISQFMTSDCINAYDTKKGEYLSRQVLISLYHQLFIVAYVCIISTHRAK